MSLLSVNALHITLLAVSIVIPLLLLLLFPATVRAILCDLRPLRILHYVVLGLMGAALYYNGKGDAALFAGPGKLLIFPLFSIALAYAAVFAIVTNNIEDLQADRISNPSRPLVTGAVQANVYLLAGIFCLAFSLLLSFLVQPEMFWGILAVSTGYFIYSCKPLKLKRVPVIAKLLIGANSLAIAVCGYVLAGGTVKTFPLLWAIFILLPLSLAANFIDLKDTEGDRAAGIRTLPVLLGEDRARLLIAFFTVCTYAMGALLAGDAWLYLPAALTAVLHCWLLYREPYNEKPVFLVYIGSLCTLVIFLFCA